MRLTLLFLLAAGAMFGQTWTGCTSPTTRQSFLYITPSTAPNPRTMFVSLNSNSTSTPPGGLWRTTNLCPSSTGQWTQISSARAGGLSPNSANGLIYIDNANAGTVPNTSHVRYLANNTTLVDTTSPVNGWGCSPDPTRNIILCLERNGDLFTSTNGFTSAIATNMCAGSPITGISVTTDGIWWLLCESVNSSRSTNAGGSWANIGSVGGAGTQIIKLQNNTYLDCDGEGNAYPRIWDGATSWNQLGSINFPGAQNTVACSRVTYVGSDIWMAANDSTFNPIIYKTSSGTGAWTAVTGTGLPNACTVKCQPRDIFYDIGSGYVYITILGSGGQPTSIYRTLVGNPGPQPFPVDSLGWIITGLSTPADNLLGPLIPSGNSPWVFGDLAESATADNMAVNALIETPTLGTACPGTASWTSGSNIITTTASMVACLSGKTYVVLAWNSVDGVGTGRAQCPLATVTATTITCQENLFEPTSSGVTAYNMPGPGPSGFDFLGWTAESPSVSWNYYDVAIGLYRLYYRTGNTTYLTQARAYADITWQWTLDHGYRFVTPRAASMISQFFRATESHLERLPGLYNWISHLATTWVPTFCPYCDNREVGYITWPEALGAKIDTDPTRHAQYCSWLTTYVPQWNAVQAADGSFGENEYAINPGFVSAPKTFIAPFLYQGAPWRMAVGPIKPLQAAYESLADTTSQGCNSPSIASATLTTITNAVTWQHNYGRDSVNGGIYYEANSQSDDQDTVDGVGTVSISLGSNALTGVGTNFVATLSATPFIGIRSSNDPRTVYKLASCSDNTHCLLTTNFGIYGESSNVSGSTYATAPSAFTSCNSSATYCFGSAGDRNLTRTVAGDTAWLYAQTLNPLYKSWTDEYLGIQLGGPTAGLTSAANEGQIALPCSGPGCTGYVADTWEAAKNCGQTVPINTSPCQYGNSPLSNLGKNFGEAFGAPGIQNALAWRLLAPTTPPSCDINNDGVVNVIDVQLMVRQVLGLSACTNRLDGTATCNVTDVQRVVNSALGAACRIGP